MDTAKVNNKNNNNNDDNSSSDIIKNEIGNSNGSALVLNETVPASSIKNTIISENHRNIGSQHENCASTYSPFIRNVESQPIGFLLPTNKIGSKSRKITPRANIVDSAFKYQHKVGSLERQFELYSNFSTESQTHLQENSPLCRNGTLENNINEHSSTSDWTTYQQEHQQHSVNRHLDLAYESFTATSSMTAAAAAAAAVTKFEHPASCASTMTSIVTSNGLTAANWPNVIGATAEWDLRSGLELDPRMISTPPYYNSSSYAAATNMRAAYLASYPQQYIRDSTTAAAVAAAASATAPFNYFAASNGINYAYGGNGTAANFVDYYGLNYYGNGSAAVAAMIGTSPMANAASLELLSGRSSSSGNNTTINVEEYKNSHGNNGNDDHFMRDLTTDPAGGVISALQHHKNISPLATSIPPTTKTGKPKKAKKKKTINGATANVDGVGSSSAAHCTTPEPSNTRAFIWELDDLCILAGNHSYCTVDNFMLQVIDQIIRCAFQIDHIDELCQVNVGDAEIDENLHEDSELYSNTVIQNSNANGTVVTNETRHSPLVGENANKQKQSQVEALPATLGYPTSALDPSTSTASTCMNINAMSSATTTANIVNREMLEGLRRISAKYKNVRTIYNTYKEDLSEFFDICGLSQQKEEILERLRKYEKMSGCQTERYRRCLRLIKERSHIMKEKCTNVVMTRESLASSAAKLLSSGLAQFIPIENIYSMQRTGRDTIFTRITERFRKQYAVMISSNSELQAFGRQENIPCWSIHGLEDVDKLYIALDTLLLFDTTSASNNNSNKQHLLNPTSALITTTPLLTIANISPGNKIYMNDGS